MSKSKKRLIVVGDRVLILPEEGEDRTKVGLYLPATAVDNQAVQGGKVVATGPGNAVSAPTELDPEPWKIGGNEAKYVPLTKMFWLSRSSSPLEWRGSYEERRSQPAGRTTYLQRGREERPQRRLSSASSCRTSLVPFSLSWRCDSHIQQSSSAP